MLPRQARVDLGAMVIKGYSTFSKLQHYWNLTIRLFCYNQDTRWGRLTSLQGCSRCILQPEPTGLIYIYACVCFYISVFMCSYIYIYIYIYVCVCVCVCVHIRV